MPSYRLTLCLLSLALLAPSTACRTTDPQPPVAVDLAVPAGDLSWSYSDLSTPATPDASDPPGVYCGDAGLCELPHSVCADPQNLRYYTNPHCVDGQCAFEEKLLYCQGFCDGDGCHMAITSGPAPLCPAT